MEIMEITFDQIITIVTSIITTLVTAVVAVYLISRRDNKKHSMETKELYKVFINDQKENIRSLTEIARDSKNALENNTRATESNTKATEKNTLMVDRLFDKINNATK